MVKRKPAPVKEQFRHYADCPVTLMRSPSHRSTGGKLIVSNVGAESYWKFCTCPGKPEVRQ